ncbi:MAG TPA: signal peptidase II [Phenylobacterium sp.]
MPHRTLCWTLSLAVLAVDQSTKLLARTHLADPIALGPLMNLRLGFNTGVTFGLFAGAGELGRWILLAGTAAVALWLSVWMWREARLSIAAPLALIVGGALGNILDRLRRGAVTDFIDAHIGSMHWPTFNLADSAIVFGVGWLVLASLRRGPPEGRNNTAKVGSRRRAGTHT